MNTLQLGKITSSNSEAVLTVESIFPQGIVFESYGTDAAWALDEVTLAQGDVGVDGVYTAGQVPTKKVITFTFSAASPTIPNLESVANAMTQNRTIYGMSLVLTVPDLERVFTFTQGTMVTAKRIPDGNKTLGQVTYKFEFANIKPSVL